MNERDNVFFEEYKHLNKLCGDMYLVQNGVSEYITQMKQNSAQGLRSVRSWSTDRRMLQHVRSVRNAIAHDTAGYQVSEDEDIEFVRDFYGRIMSGNDPLTLLRKSAEPIPLRRRGTGEQHKDKHDPVPNTSSSGGAMKYHDKQQTDGSHQNGDTRYRWVSLIAAIIVTAAIIGLFVLNN